MAVTQRKEPAAAAGRTSGQCHRADLQHCSQCRRECQQCVGQLTTVLLTRDRGPRTTVFLGLAGSNRPRWNGHRPFSTLRSVDRELAGAGGDVPEWQLHSHPSDRRSRDEHHDVRTRRSEASVPAVLSSSAVPAVGGSRRTTHADWHQAVFEPGHRQHPSESSAKAWASFRTAVRHHYRHSPITLVAP
jgi:hypothetical protein